MNETIVLARDIAKFMIQVMGFKRLMKLKDCDMLLTLYQLYKSGYPKRMIQRWVDEKSLV